MSNRNEPEIHVTDNLVTQIATIMSVVVLTAKQVSFSDVTLVYVNIPLDVRQCNVVVVVHFDVELFVSEKNTFY